MRIRIALVVALVAFAVLIPVTASAQIPRCDTVEHTPCGGELVGTWSYTGIECFDPPDMSAAFPGCVGLEVVFDGTLEGAVTFMADGSYVDVQTTSMAFGVHVPLTCLPEGATCTAIAGVDGTQTETHCIINHAENETETELGTWVAEGTSATLTESDGSSDIGHYCVDGETLRVKLVDAEAGLTAIVGHLRAH